MKRTIETIKRWDRRHQDWVGGLAPWQEALYVAFHCALLFGLWQIRPF